MRIGVDIDGVLNDVALFELEYGSKYYIENTNKHLTNPYGKGTWEIFEGSNEEDNNFWRKAIYQFVKYPARDFASEVIQKLKKEGHEIYIVTARTSDLSYCDISIQKMKKYVKKWLRKYHIHYDDIIWTNKEKTSFCLKNNIDVMIDDNPKHLKEVSVYIPVICYSSNQNHLYDGPNMTRCYSWYDIYDKIYVLDKIKHK